jgi:hypothetical protein
MEQAPRFERSVEASSRSLLWGGGMASRGGGSQGREAGGGHSPGPYVMAVSPTGGRASAPLNYHRLAVSQRACVETQALLESPASRWPVSVSRGRIRGVRGVRPIIPRDCRQSIFHPGIWASRRLVSAHFVCPRL